MSTIQAVISILSASLLGACVGAYVDYAPTRAVVPLAPVPAEAVAVYVGAPPCAYSEIGIMEAHDGSMGSSLEDKLWAMRSTAGRNGANGVIVIDHQDSGDHHSTDHHYTGLAVVVDCRAPGEVSPTRPPGL